MKGIIILGLIVALLVALGFVMIQNEDGKTTITIDTQKMRETGAEVVEKGKEILHEATDRGSKGEPSP